MRVFLFYLERQLIGLSRSRKRKGKTKKERKKESISNSRLTYFLRDLDEMLLTILLLHTSVYYDCRTEEEQRFSLITYSKKNKSLFLQWCFFALPASFALLSLVFTYVGRDMSHLSSGITNSLVLFLSLSRSLSLAFLWASSFAARQIVQWFLFCLFVLHCIHALWYGSISSSFFVDVLYFS